MKNVVIFGINYEKVLKTSKQLAKILNCKHTDAQQQFNKILLKYATKPTMFMNDELEEQESNLCLKLSKLEQIISMPDDMFLSNENYINFDNSTKIFVLSGTKSKLKKGIENLLISKANFTIDENTNLQNLANKIL